MSAPAVYVGEVLRCLDPSEPDDAARDGHESSADWIVRLRSDDPHAFESLLTTFASPLEGYAYRLTGSSDAAADIVQDVFAHVWEQRHTLRIRGSVRSYLYSAIRHRTIDIQRRDRAEQARWDVASEGDVPVGMGGSAEHADVMLERQEIITRVTAALATLPPRVREAALLRWVDGLSRAEVATVMGVALGTVKNQLSHATEVVRTLLADLRTSRE